MANDEVPKIPRAGARGFKPSSPQLFKIALTGALLVLIIVVRKPCSDSVSGFVTSFDKPGPGSGSGSGRGTGTGPNNGSAASEMITPEMTPEEVKAAIERVRAKAEAERAKRGGSNATMP